MKKIMMAAATIALMSAGTAVAQDEEVLIGSIVSQECNIDAVSTTSNLTVSNDQTVADVTLECNYYGNVEVNVSSGGAYELEHSSGAAALAVPYTVDYENSPGFDFLGIGFNNQAGPFTVTIPNTAGQLLTPQNAEIQININSLAGGEDIGSLYAGTYSDTIDLELVLN